MDCLVHFLRPSNYWLVANTVIWLRDTALQLNKVKKIFTKEMYFFPDNSQDCVCFVSLFPGSYLHINTIHEDILAKRWN